MPAMRLAARFRTDARTHGLRTTPDTALDADVILAAQAATLLGTDVAVATTTIGHIGRLVAADAWWSIRP